MTLADFRRDQTRRGLSEATIRGRDRTLNQFLRWYAPEDILAATSADIETWLDDCDIGPRSRYTYLVTLGAFYRFAKSNGLIATNPVRRIRRPRLGRLLPHPIKADDLALALGHADETMRVWLTLAAFMGFRCIEIANLRAEDVMGDADPPSVAVRTGKGGKDRIVPLNLHVEQALAVHGMPDRGYVFRLRCGRRLTAGTVSSYINRYLAGLNIRASAHSCRHHFGTVLYRNTKDIRLTQEMLGHADPKTTAMYVAFDMGDATAAIRSLGVHGERRSLWSVS